MADMADSNSADGAPQVRFAAVDEEIEPAHGAVNMEHLHISGEEETGLHESLQALPAANPLQGRRMSNFAYEPVSNPATRVSSLNSLFTSESRGITIGAKTSSMPCWDDGPCLVSTCGPSKSPRDPLCGRTPDYLGLDTALAAMRVAQRSTPTYR